MKHTTSSNELLEFIKKNGDVSEDAFMNIIYECILNKIAYEKCNSLKNDNKIEDFKKKSKNAWEEW